MLALSDAASLDPLAGPATGLDGGTKGRWFGVHCQPHREKHAAAHLTIQQFKVFLPCRQMIRRHARKTSIVRKPLFPGYLFIHLDVSRDRWRCINSTFGVVRIVMQNELPAAAPQGVVESLRDACDESGIFRWQPCLVLGQAVRVVMGPFADFVGQLDQLSDADRVGVLLDILGARTKVSLPRNCVVPTNSCF